MTWYALWRGDTLLGRFAQQHPVTHHGQRVGAAGFLDSTDAFTGFRPLMQTRVRIFPGAPVFQSPMGVIDFSQADVQRADASGPVPLEPLSADEARGVPADQVLVIRDAADNVVDADMVSLWYSVLPADADLAEISRSHGASGKSIELWYVSYAKYDTVAT